MGRRFPNIRRRLGKSFGHYIVLQIHLQQKYFGWY
jgi:hypothetical protein